jgi:hypothetical protein
LLPTGNTNNIKSKTGYNILQCKKLKQKLRINKIINKSIKSPPLFKISSSAVPSGTLHGKDKRGTKMQHPVNTLKVK